MVCERCLGLIQHQKDWLPAGAVDPGRLFSFVFNKDAIQSASQPLNKTFHHHQLARDLKAAAEDGCYFCSSFWDMITAEEKDRLIGTDPSEAPASDNGGSDSFVTMCVFLDVRVMMDQIGASAGDFLGLDPRSFVWSIRITRPDFVVSADRLTSMFLALPVYDTQAEQFTPAQVAPRVSDETWSLAKKWIRDCIANHEQCGQMRTAGWYPTRLVEIDRMGSRDPRLIITSDIHPAGPYITLSHRWGSAEVLRLTTDRLAGLKKAIPIFELPGAFVDAFSVARKLAVRYIWIDSLCIIQDSEVDWFNEASQMDRVYTNSLCNISATGAADSSEGLFLNGRPPILQPPQIEVTWRGTESAARVGPSRFLFIHWRYWEAQISNRPLNRRGWVLQERLLARRILHFGQQQLLWECCESEACEQYPSNMPYLLIRSIKHFPISDDTRLLRFWHTIVEAYNSTSITRSSDKVIALSGLASRFCALRPHDTYLAGLWLSRLPTELNWRVMGCTQADGRPSALSSGYRAPSFSWLNLDGLVWTHHPYLNPDAPSLISVIEARVLPAVENGNTIHALGGGWIRLKGCLKQVKLLRNPGSAEPVWMIMVGAAVSGITESWYPGIMTIEKWWRGLPVFRPETVGPMAEEKSVAELQWLLLPSSVFLDEALPDVVPDEGLCAVGLLGSSEQSNDMEGLVLTHLESNPGNTAHHRGQFKRIGKFKIIGKEAVSFMLKHNKADINCPCEYFDQNTESHTFTIV